MGGDGAVEIPITCTDGSGSCEYSTTWGSAKSGSVYKASTGKVTVKTGEHQMISVPIMTGAGESTLKYFTIDLKGSSVNAFLGRCTVKVIPAILDRPTMVAPKKFHSDGCVDLEKNWQAIELYEDKQGLAAIVGNRV